jgi:hypothetical protein
MRALAHSKHLEIMVTRMGEAGLERLGVFRSDLPAILRECCIIYSERRGQQWRRTVQGRDADGMIVTLVVTIAYSQRRIVVLELVEDESANDR